MGACQEQHLGHSKRCDLKADCWDTWNLVLFGGSGCQAHGVSSCVLASQSLDISSGPWAAEVRDSDLPQPSCYKNLFSVQ